MDTNRTATFSVGKNNPPPSATPCRSLERRKAHPPLEGIPGLPRKDATYATPAAR